MNEMFYKLKLEELKDIQNQRKLTDEEYFMFHRIENYLQSLQYNMKYFIYQGGICPSTLDFCRKRDNSVYSIDELMEWKYDPERPDIEGYDPILHLGGNKCFQKANFCNHSLSFITESAALRLRPELKTDIHLAEKTLLNGSLDSKIINSIERVRSKLYVNASSSHKLIIDQFLNYYANNVLGKNEKLMRDGKEISIDEALEDLTKSIVKVLESAKFKL